ncbi:MAG: DUF47 family protein [Nitrospinae bacterium]|nr:DUF47 family protein [Nitrospinota bacterium]
MLSDVVGRLSRFFFPEEVDFFGPMGEMLKLISSGVDLYLDACSKQSLTQEEKERLLDNLKRLEKKGDEILVRVAGGLKRTFTPPYSAMDLRRMFECLDNAVDMLDESAKLVIHSNYRSGFPAFVSEQLEIYRKGIAEAMALPELMADSRANMGKIAATLDLMNAMETAADAVYWRHKKEILAGINAAAEANRLMDYRRGMMDEMILDRMEELLDTLVDMIKTVEDLLIEHA